MHLSVCSSPFSGISLCIGAAHPLLLAPSTTLRTADLLDLGVSGGSESLTGRFSVDLESAAGRPKAQRTKPSCSTQNLNYGRRWDCAPNSQHGVLMMVCLITSLLGGPCSKRLERSSRNHSPVATFSSLQTVPTAEWTQQPSGVCSNMTNPPKSAK